MRYPSREQRDSARSQKAGDFDLTPRALKFARAYATTPHCSISAAARAAGYSDRARGAHVRGCELLRDPRVVRAIIHFGFLALARVRSDAIECLADLGKDQRDTWGWSYWHRHAIKRARLALDKLEPHTRRIERVYETRASEAPVAALKNSPRNLTFRSSEKTGVGAGVGEISAAGRRST